MGKTRRKIFRKKSRKTRRRRVRRYKGGFCKASEAAKDELTGSNGANDKPHNKEQTDNLVQIKQRDNLQVNDPRPPPVKKHKLSQLVNVGKATRAQDNKEMENAHAENARDLALKQAKQSLGNATGAVSNIFQSFANRVFPEKEKSN